VGRWRRDGVTAQAFIRDLADRLATRVQLTTDGHKAYLEAVEGAFGNAIDYALLIKMYQGDSGKRVPAERRCSPAVCAVRSSRPSRTTRTRRTFQRRSWSSKASPCG